MTDLSSIKVILLKPLPESRLLDPGVPVLRVTDRLSGWTVGEKKAFIFGSQVSNITYSLHSLDEDWWMVLWNHGLMDQSWDRCRRLVLENGASAMVNEVSASLEQTVSLARKMLLRQICSEAMFLDTHMNKLSPWAPTKRELCSIIHVPIGPGEGFTVTLCGGSIAHNPHTSDSREVTCPKCLEEGRRLYDLMRATLEGRGT